MFEFGLFVLPFSFTVAWLTAGVLALESLVFIKRPWAVPALAVYGTTAAWYLFEPMYFPEEFLSGAEVHVQNVFLQVILCLLAFRILVPRTTAKFVGDLRLVAIPPTTLSTEGLFKAFVGMWLFLLVCGVFRLGGDVFGALFPLGGRTAANMWGRAAAQDAGTFGSLVSLAGYLYLFTVASFGVFLILLRSSRFKAFALALILISWPYFILGGSRNAFLGVFVPGLLAFIFYSKMRPIFKFSLCVVCFVAVDFIFRIVITYRDVGFSVNTIDFSTVEETKHLGLGMASELRFINELYDFGELGLTYGGRYLEEFYQLIPRFIWPDKPQIGIEYAIARGFGGADGDIGVFATISSGFIGQGFLNFGPWGGPIAAAGLMAMWAGVLARWQAQGTSTFRRFLFLLGVGLTFNLGREITLLVLWPVVFGYAIARVMEYYYRASPRLIRSALTY